MMEVDLNKRYQAMIILWFALLMSVGMYFLVSAFVGPELETAPANAGSSMTIALLAAGTTLVILSFAIKQKLLKRSVDQQDVTLVQKTLIVTCIICEVAALLGLIGRFTGNRYYYLLFILAAAGMALHFPKRSQLEAASYKSTSSLV